MFVSLNRKIIYTILSLFLVTSLIFGYTFYLIYGNKIQNEQLYSIQRNQQYIDLLFKNINVIREFRNILHNNPNIKIDETLYKNLYLSDTEEDRIAQLNNEQKQIAQMRQSYDQRYKAIQESLRIFIISTLLLITSILLLGLLITKWILNPINNISKTSSEVSLGNLSVRIKNTRQSHFVDELDYLIQTFNSMLDTLQQTISEVQDKEAFLQSLIDSIPDGIRVIDKKHNIIIANKAYYKQVGSNNRNCIKCYESSQNIKTPCPSEVFHCPVKEILQNRKKNIKLVQQFSAFPQKHLSINAAPMNYQGKNQYVVEAIRDLSDDINFSHQQKLSSLGFLSTSIAHEIKNHLGALRMLLERQIDRFYINRDDNDEEKQNIMLIYNELINSIAVPERLLKLTQSSSDAKKINVKENLNDVICLLDYEAKRNGISIEYKFPNKDIFIQGNSSDFKMVAINIILNAIKAMDNKGILTISIKQNAKKQTIISFSDTGVGISPENMPRIFDPFFSEGKDNIKKGAGLGLSITKSLVEKYNGSISVSSTIGSGSCFTLSFPSIKNVAKK
ncbi:MAG: HAMP domain-containing protein [Alphaproteobacteria bacterium]|nr:HAMP domain-containing protein [Alphaproteobacteria bacterium]